VFVSIATALVFGLLPALRTSMPNVHTTMKEGTTTVHSTRVRGLLVVGELALALILLAGAGDLMKSFLMISAASKGQSDGGVLTGNLEFLDAKYRDPAAIRHTVDALEERLQHMPGVTAAALDHTAFIAGFGGHDETIRVEGLATLPAKVSPRFYHVATPGYLAAVGLPLVDGRPLLPRDGAGAERVALINRAAAAALWPGASPLGRRVKLGSAHSLPWVTIVGVVGDVAERGRPRNYLYVPYDQAPAGPATIFLRATGNGRSLTNAVRAAVREVDRDLPVLDLQTVEQQRHQNFSPYKFYAMSMAAFAALAVMLAAIGLYGVIAYETSQRTREIGIRVALGARSADVVRLVTRQAARLVLFGIAIGLLGALGILRVIQGLLFGASPIDLPIFAGVSLVLIGVAMLASYLPARAAARVSPLDALRTD
jgi:putative ABC transport system permease protein